MKVIFLQSIDGSPQRPPESVRLSNGFHVSNGDSLGERSVTTMMAIKGGHGWWGNLSFSATFAVSRTLKLGFNSFCGWIVKRWRYKKCGYITLPREGVHDRLRPPVSGEARSYSQRLGLRATP